MYSITSSPESLISSSTIIMRFGSSFRRSEYSNALRTSVRIALASKGGTAFPICFFISVLLPAKVWWKGKLWKHASSLGVNLRLPFGWTSHPLSKPLVFSVLTCPSQWTFEVCNSGNRNCIGSWWEVLGGMKPIASRTVGGGNKPGSNDGDW